MRLLTGIIGLFIICTSCTQHNSSYLDQISDLKNRLEKANQAYDKIDSLEISTIRKTVKSNSVIVAELGDKDMEKTLISYSHINKSLKQVLRMDKVIRDDYSRSVIQLGTLYHDIENNIIKEEVFKNYLLEEKMIVESIIERMEFNTFRTLSELHKFDSLNPIITEKATILSEQNKTVFKVHEGANKKTIKKNIEKLFKVNVVKVNIINQKSKLKMKQGKKSVKSGYKKAIITLKKGQSIDLTTGI